MTTSYIVLFGIILYCLLKIPSILNGICELYKMFLNHKKEQKIEQQNKKIESIKNDLKETINSGDLQDLINVSKELGELKKKELKNIK